LNTALKNRTILIVLLVVGISGTTNAQDTLKMNNQLKISSYVDTYFSALDTKSAQQDFQPFLSTGARDNSFGINIAQAAINYENDFLRSEVIFHMGDIPSATWSNDFPALQAANVGLKLKDNLWLDAGFFSTHLGTESFLPKNNMLSSITVLTFHEPFYQAGAKLSWDATDSWYAELLLLNGYHSFVDNNDAKSIGVLLSKTLSDNTSVTYTNLYGKENDPGTPAQTRFYQNVYLNHQINENISLVAGVDVGVQSNSDLNNADKPAMIYGGLITVRYQFDPKWSITGRGELMKDEDGFISGVIVDANGRQRGLEIAGFTLGSEYRPNETAYLRTEFRYVKTPYELKVFFDGAPTNARLEFLVTLGIEIGKIFKF
jgi:hypothetical protein